MRMIRGLVLVFLMAVSLSCNLPFVPKISKTTVNTVSVAPPVGEKDFSLTVTYSYQYIRGENSATIHCTYTTAGGSVVVIKFISPSSKEFNEDGKTYSNTEAIPFQVKPINGKIETGIYTASCSTQFTGSEVKTTFAVVEGNQPQSAAPQSEATEAPVVATDPPVIALPSLKGKITFDYAGYQSDRPSGAGELDLVTKTCIPDVTFTPTGELIGNCDFSGDTNHMTSVSIVKATVTGIANSGGNISFTYDVSETGPNGWNLEPGHIPSVPVWSNNYLWQVVYVCTGTFTSATEASGVANFTYTCDSGADNLIWCGDSTKETFSGTLPWKFAANSQ